MILLNEYLGLPLESATARLACQKVRVVQIRYTDPRGNAPGEDPRVIRAMLQSGVVILTYCSFKTQV